MPENLESANSTLTPYVEFMLSAARRVIVRAPRADHHVQDSAVREGSGERSEGVHRFSVASPSPGDAPHPHGAGGPSSCRLRMHFPGAPPDTRYGGGSRVQAGSARMYRRHGAMSMAEPDLCRWPSSEHRQARGGVLDPCSTVIGPCFDVGTSHDKSLRMPHCRQEAGHRSTFLTSPCLPFPVRDTSSHNSESGLSASDVVPKAQFTTRSRFERLRHSHPSSVTSTEWPRVMARPLSEFITIMCRKNTLPGCISRGLAS